MERYQVTLTYDGTRFKGFQKQQNARTVQGVFEEALRKLGWQGKSVLFAGRTDSGVHALGQVVAYDLNWIHPLADMLKALNNYLPGDVAVRAVASAAEDFHPRYSALARRYHYRLFEDAIRSPLQERYAWRIWPKLARRFLQQACTHLLGSHDFSAFGAPHEAGGSTRRKIFRAECFEDGSDLVFEIVGNAFLYHMVRRLVFFLVQIGQGKFEPDALKGYLDGGKPLPLHGLAPAQGLYLIEVIYPSSEIKWNNLDLVEGTL